MIEMDVTFVTTRDASISVQDAAISVLGAENESAIKDLLVL